MRLMRIPGVVLILASWIGFHSSRAEAAVAWSTNGASCVPVGSSTGVHVATGAVTAGAGITVTLYCGITKAALTGGFSRIEITSKGRHSGSAAVSSSQLVEMSKATGVESVRCGVVNSGSDSIKTDSQVCENSTNIDFNLNFYYLRIVLKSSIVNGQLQTFYGSSLTD